MATLFWQSGSNRNRWVEDIAPDCRWLEVDNFTSGNIIPISTDDDFEAG
jgi:hypothetical protein